MLKFFYTIYIFSFSKKHTFWNTIFLMQNLKSPLQLHSFAEIQKAQFFIINCYRLWHIPFEEQPPQLPQPHPVFPDLRSFIFFHPIPANAAPIINTIITSIIKHSFSSFLRYTFIILPQFISVNILIMNLITIYDHPPELFSTSKKDTPQTHSQGPRGIFPLPLSSQNVTANLPDLKSPHCLHPGPALPPPLPSLPPEAGSPALPRPLLPRRESRHPY